ncbi:MAG: alanine racemase [Ruminococcaceae bacterium]|nr:alanine racemase [Oscillospiraceae bacterium]
MEDMQRAWAEIDLDAISHNVKEIKNIIRPDVKLMAVVKADAYGHGAFEVAKACLESGAERLGVAFSDEAVELRKKGIGVPILLLGVSMPDAIESIIKYDITPAVADVEFAQQLSKAAVAAQKTVKVHIKADTGMFRIGFQFTGDDKQRLETVEKIVEISKLPNIEIEGMFTHLSTADEEGRDYTKRQLANFMELDAKLKERGVEIPIRHIANSAGQIRYPELQLDMVRAGIILYGLYPSDEVSYEPLELKPAMKFKARVVNVKNIEKGDSISYGRSFTAEKSTRLATISVGYADGYSRIMSGRAVVSVNGKKVPQVGRICMDQCMIDVSGVNNIDIGDEVTLFGDGAVSAESVAANLGTINYEVVCMVGRRVPRIYIKDRKIEKSINYLLENDGQ